MVRWQIRIVCLKLKNSAANLSARFRCTPDVEIENLNDSNGQTAGLG